MKEVLPIIIICSIGIAVCIAYIVVLCVRSVRGRKKKSRNCFEIEDDVLTIHLDKKK